jgi:hypothetical protein
MFQGVDHHWRDSVYATCGDQVDIWNEDRSEPVRSFQWGVDTVHSVKFNPVEVIHSKRINNIFKTRFLGLCVTIDTLKLHNQF